MKPTARSRCGVPGPFGAARGFTLMELMIVVTISALLISLAVPGFRDVLLDNRMATEVNTLVAGLRLARSEAIKRNRTVTICPSGDARSCAGPAAWSRGWIVFEDRNGNRKRDRDEEVIRREARLASTSVLTSGRRKSVSYFPNGMSRGSTATFTFCDPRGAGKARAVILSNAGRHRISDKRPGGGPLQCVSSMRDG